ncbi:MAG: N-acetyltransferase [Verrucomicrobiaceae bacterium]|nr:MAG: N-acetyltransferase [Verrucomicrobiaceae bacterium]
MKAAPSHPPGTMAQPRRAVFSGIGSVARLHWISFFDAMPPMPVPHTPEEDLNHWSAVVFPNTEIWISERFGMVEGIISFRSSWVDRLYAHPDHQSSGIGGTLLALAQASQPSLRLWTFQCNSKARRFYKRHGFRIEKEADGTGNGGREPDVLYFWSRHAMDPQAGQGGGNPRTRSGTECFPHCWLDRPNRHGVRNHGSIQWSPHSITACGLTWKTLQKIHSKKFSVLNHS